MSISLSAQSDEQDLLKQMEQMQEEMLKQLENMEFNFGDSQFLIDTFFIKEFDPQKDWPSMEHGFTDPSGMMDLLEKQMEKMDRTDWDEIEKLFKSFGDFAPITPDNGKGGDNIKKSPNKKRKTYTL